MTFPDRPGVRPGRPHFSSGPCAKRPGWTAEAVVSRAWLGRSHRAAGPKAQLKSVQASLPDGVEVVITYDRYGLIRDAIATLEDTLLEEMIVVAIVGVLASLAIYGVRKYVTNAKTTEARNALGQLSKDATTAFAREKMDGTVLDPGEEPGLASMTAAITRFQYGSASATAASRLMPMTMV